MSDRAKYLLVQYVTVARVPLAIVTAVLLQYAQALRPLGYLVVAILLVQELTDIVDGLLARRLGMSSRFGALFDPYCDSMARLITFFGLASAGLCGYWLFMLMALRDISVSYIRIMCILSGKQIAARFSGKTKAWVQGLGAIVLAALYVFAAPAGTPLIQVTRDQITVPAWTPQAITIVIAAITLWSLLDYFKAARQPAPQKS